MSPSTTSSDDPYIIDRMGCSSVLVCVAEEWFRERGSMHNEEVLEKSGWKGEVELM